MTIHENAIETGGFIGSLSGVPPLINCAWDADNYAHAIGRYGLSYGLMLADQSWGTDEADNTNFFPKEHVVYAQGT